MKTILLSFFLLTTQLLLSQKPIVVKIANQKMGDFQICSGKAREEPTIIPDTDKGKVRSLAAEIQFLIIDMN